MKHKKKQPTGSSPLYKSVVHLWDAIPQSNTDPNGSYTGRTANKKETPVQDSDDL